MTQPHKVFELIYLGDGLTVRREGDKAPPQLVELLLHGKQGLPTMAAEERAELARLLRHVATGALGNDEIEKAVEAAYREIVRQLPEAVDCSPAQDKTEVLTFNGIDLRRLVSVVLKANP